MEKTPYKELFEAYVILICAGLETEEAMRILTEEFIKRGESE